MKVEEENFPGFDSTRTLILILLIIFCGASLHTSISPGFKPGFVDGVTKWFVFSLVFSAVALFIRQLISRDVPFSLKWKVYSYYVPPALLFLAIICFLYALIKLFVATQGIINSSLTSVFTITPFGLLLLPKKLDEDKLLCRSLAERGVDGDVDEAIVKTEVIIIKTLKVAHFAVAFGFILIILSIEYWINNWSYPGPSCGLGVSESCSATRFIEYHLGKVEPVWNNQSYWFLFLAAILITIYPVIKEVYHSYRTSSDLDFKSNSISILDKAILDSLSFFQNKIRDDHWEDFDIYDVEFKNRYGFDGPGASDSWITAYVLCKTAGLNRDFDDNFASKGVDWLRLRFDESGKESKIEKPRWGYNMHTRSDADTSAFALRACALFGKQRQDMADHLLKFFDGAGFRTFIPRSPSNPDPWELVRCDVTPAAFLALREYTSVCQSDDYLGKNNYISDNVIRYIKSEFSNAEFVWPSYWWYGHLYVARECICALSASNQMDGKLYAEKFWSANFDKYALSKLNSFELALCVDILAIAEHLDCVRYTRELLKRQGGDGSWPESRILRHSAKTIYRTDWSVVDKRGECFRDQNRIFTTATAVFAIGNARRYLQLHK